MDVLHPQLHSHAEGSRTWPVLVWRTAGVVRTISSAPAGGGLGLCSWVLNAPVPLSYARRDPQAHVASLAAVLGLKGPGVGMLTAAQVEAVRCAGDLDDCGVQVAATVGLRVPTWAAAETVGLADASAAAGHPGTINVVAYVPQRLSDAALVNAVGTLTEAKSQALWDAGVDGTGTATDAVCICCPDTGVAADFAGPRSEWGARLAVAVHAAVLAGARAWPPR